MLVAGSVQFATVRILVCGQCCPLPQIVTRGRDFVVVAQCSHCEPDSIGMFTASMYRCQALIRHPTPIANAERCISFVLVSLICVGFTCASQISIRVTSEKYRPVANRSSLLFFLMNDLVKIHSYYIYSLAAFTKVCPRTCHGLDRFVVWTENERAQAWLCDGLCAYLFNTFHVSDDCH